MKKFIVALLFSLLFVVPSFANSNPILPNLSLTPGVTDPAATLKKLCKVGYTTTVRNVPESIKAKVFEEYGIDPKSDKFEIDHMISLEIGGANDIKNLWPQSYDTMPFNAHTKDKLENRLHKLVCAGTITLEEAQKQITTDWIKTYCTYYTDKVDECNKYNNH